MSSICLTVIPAACKAVMADSRPEPGPLTRTSISFTPNLAAFSAACCAASCPAYGVLFREPLKPLVPALAQQSVSPLVSVIVTVVLLNVALMYAIAEVTLRRTLRRLLADEPESFDCVLATAGPFLRGKNVGLDYKTEGLHRLQSLQNQDTKFGECTKDYRKSLTPFLPATVFRGPFRVRALVRVRWPRTGKPCL